MITIDHGLCQSDGLCVRVCHQGCLSLIEGRLYIDHTLCSTCAQCIAVCPRGAISWDNVPPSPCQRERLPSPDQIDELLKERHSVRAFRPDRLDRALLAEIAGYGIYAPTNNYALRAIAVDDPALIQEFDRAIMGVVKRFYDLLYRPRLVFNVLRKLTPAMTATDKVKTERVLARGYVLHHPPAIIFVVGDKRIGLSEASAQYALYNMMLYAQTKDIGSCLWGNAPIILDRQPAARARMGLLPHEHILGAVQMGYPRIKFAHKVAGKVMPLTWVGEAPE